MCEDENILQQRLENLSEMKEIMMARVCEVYEREKMLKIQMFGKETYCNVVAYLIGFKNVGVQDLTVTIVDTAAFWNFAAARYSLVETDSPF